MSKHINAAFRLHRIATALSQADPKRATVEVLAGVLGISTPPGVDQRVAVDKLRTIVIDQIESVQRNMRKLALSEELYVPYVTALRQQLGSLNLDQPWQSYRPNVSEAMLLSLLWCSEVLPHEEEAIPPEDVAKWIATIEDLLSRIPAAGLLPEVQVFITQNLMAVRDALRAYQVTGLKSIEEALLRAQGDAGRRSRALRAHATSAHSGGNALVDDFRQVVAVVATAVDEADRSRSPDTPLLAEGTYAPERLTQGYDEK